MPDESRVDSNKTEHPSGKEYDTVTERTTTRFDGVRRIAVRAMLPILATTATLAGGVAIGQPATAATQTIRYTAGDDAYTSTRAPGHNTGGAVKLKAGRSGSDTMVSYLMFTVDKLPTGGTIERAEVDLTTDGTRLPGAVQISKVPSTGWDEDKLTNRNRPHLEGVVATVKPKSSATAVSFDVTSAVTKPGTYSFAVTSTVADRPAIFRSAEYKTNRPTLELKVTKAVTPTPSPSTPVPSTPAPTTPAPTTPAPTTPPEDCEVDAKLVPSCNILWGAAAGGFSDTPRDQALREWEAKSGRTASVYHTYHRGDELFPTKAEIAMANEPGKPRLLFLNWKVNWNSNWAKVAAGQQDARIDRLSKHIKANYQDKFFLTIHHEPENDVRETAGSGYTSKNYAAMFRHTVERMRANGVDNAVFVMSYMGLEKFYNQSWWHNLYPGDDVVDWIGLDAYVASKPGGYHYGTLTDLMNRTTDVKKFPGFYNWHQATHPDKPLMLSEWGVHEYAADPSEKAKTLSTVLAELKNFPDVQGMFWFDTASDQNGSDIRIDSSKQSLAEFRKIAADPRFDVEVRP